MIQVVNFRKISVSASSLEELAGKAPFELVGDATRDYRSIPGDADVNRFMMDYLADKLGSLENAVGKGFYVVLDKAVENARKRPYAIKDVTSSGKRSYEKTYQLVDDGTGKILAQTSVSKKEAKRIARDLYKEKGFTGDITCLVTKQVVKGEGIAFRAYYSPTVNAHEGNYVLFGIEG